MNMFIIDGGMMKKNLKKVIQGLLVLMIAFPSMVTPITNVKAKTLGDLKRELDALEADAKENEHQKELTEQQMNEIRNNIDQIGKDMEQMTEDIKRLTAEIVALNKDIEKKDMEMKEIVNFVQISNGESAYLEYMFGAKDFTDLIYRIAVSEQLADYNRDLIKSFNQMIDENNKKKKELADEQVRLDNKRDELSNELKKLNQQLREIADTSISIEEDIEAQREIIQMYEDLDCKDDEDINICGKSKLPPDTMFWRPMEVGYVTSEWGGRWGSFHEGIDISMSPSWDVPIYASAKGIVASTIYHSSCGGNMVLIHHNIGGHNYTSLYAHLRRIDVSKGDYVDKNTRVGIMGGHADTTVSGGGWDSCSFGPHLHFTISDGLYGIDYSSWDTLIARSMNPRDYVNFPNGGNTFYDRITRY